MNKKIFLILVLLFFSISNLFADSNLKIKLSKTGQGGTFKENLILNKGDSYYLQITYLNGDNNDQVRFNLPPQNNFDKIISANFDTDTYFFKEENTLLFKNLSDLVVILKIDTDLSVEGFNNKQAQVDTDQDGEFIDIFSNTVNLNFIKNPKILSANYYDTDFNGKLDQLRILFNKDITGNLDGTGFNIEQNNCSEKRSIQSFNYNNKVLTFDFFECNFYDTGELPNLTYNKEIGDLKDLSDLELLDIKEENLIESNKALPYLISYPENANGEKVYFVFSEILSEDQLDYSLKYLEEDLEVVVNNKDRKELILSNYDLSGEKTLNLKVKDIFGNLLEKNLSINFTKENIAPKGLIIGDNKGIRIAEGDLFVSKREEVFLELKAQDDEQVVSMCLTGDFEDSSNCSLDSSFQAYQEDFLVNLTEGDSIKKIKVKFKDSSDNISDFYTDTIILNTITPRSELNKTGGKYSNSQEVYLKASQKGMIYAVLLSDTNVSCEHIDNIITDNDDTYFYQSFFYDGENPVKFEDENGSMIGNRELNPDKLCFYTANNYYREPFINSEIYEVSASLPKIILKNEEEKENSNFYVADNNLSLVLESDGNYSYTLETDSNYQAGGVLLNGNLGDDFKENLILDKSNFSLGENIFYIFIDNSLGGIVKRKIIVYQDKTSPENLNLIFNNGEEKVSNSQVTVYFFAQDLKTQNGKLLKDSGVKSYCLEGDFDETKDCNDLDNFVSYSNNQSLLNLNNNNEENEVSIKFMDFSGNISEKLTKNIFLDQQGPVITKSKDSDYFYQDFTFTLTTEENARIYYTINDEDPNLNSSSSLEELNLEINSKNKSNYIIKFFARDEVGNNSELDTVIFRYSRPSGGSGGSSGGGSNARVPDTSSLFKLPDTESKTELSIYRPFYNLKGEINRPLKVINYYKDSFYYLKKGTKIFTLKDDRFDGVLRPFYSKKTEKFNKIKKPQEKLIYDSYFVFSDSEEFFKLSQKIEGKIYFSSSLSNYLKNNKNIKIIKWNFLENEWEDFLLEIKLDNFDFNLIENTAFALVERDKNEEGFNKEGFNEEEDKEDFKKEDIYNNLTDIKGHWAENYIIDLYKKGSLQGIGNTKQFKPNFSINRVSFLKLVWETLDLKQEKLADNVFVDVDENSWYYPYLNSAYIKGVVKGNEVNLGVNKVYQYGDYNLEDISKIQKILKTYGYFNYSPSGYFGRSTQTALVNFQKDKGLLVTGAYDLQTAKFFKDIKRVFRPNDKINRAEALKIIYKALNKKITQKDFEYLKFKDVDKSLWYAPYLNEAVKDNIVKGKTKDFFEPNSPLTRAEAVKILFLLK
jgi:hypothetical protein